MPQADFYLLEQARYREDPLRVVCVLAKRAHAALLPTTILASSLEEAEALDDKLWSFEADAYIPHQIAGDEDDEDTPVLIAPPGAVVASRALVINLREECAEPGFDTVKEVIPPNPDAREGSRRRWAEYRRRGVEVRKFDL